MARSLTAIVLLLCSLAIALEAQVPVPRQVRPLDAAAAESLQRGLRESEVVRRLVRMLDAGTAIVHVETSTPVPRGLAGMTRLVANRTRLRYIRITLDRALPIHPRTSTLAHELQHALELSDSGVADQHEVKRLYERIGYRVSGMQPFYETAAARRAGAQAWSELRGHAPTEGQR